MLAALQRQLIYFPDSTAVPPAGEVFEGARDITLRTSDGLALGAWFVPPSSASDMHMAVLVAPGNGGNRLGRLGLAAELSLRGLAVVLMDYRGYGGNPGSPSEDGLAKDAMAAVIYGDRDSVVPTQLSARVADEAPTLVERVVLRGANHNDEVMFGPPVADAVARLAKAVA
jgi:pimeloyl-ACP methyl ester carboxylesterase